VKYAWIKQHINEFSVSSMCRFMNVSRSAYYAWLERRQMTLEKEDIELIEMIKVLFEKGRENYGTRRLKKALAGKGWHISGRRIGRLMRIAGIACKTRRKFKVTTDSKHSLPIAPNRLDRQFSATQPNQTYVGNITYIYTQEGWLYLAVVIDLYSRQVVGWSTTKKMDKKNSTLSIHFDRNRLSPRIKFNYLNVIVVFGMPDIIIEDVNTAILLFYTHTRNGSFIRA